MSEILLEPKVHHLQWVRVVFVYDSEKLLVESGTQGFRVRLAGFCGPAQGGSKFEASKKAVMNAVLGRWVGLENHAQQWDGTGVRVASVWFGDDFKNNLAEELISQQLGVRAEPEHPNLHHLKRLYHPRGVLTGDYMTDILPATVPEGSGG